MNKCNYLFLWYMEKTLSDLDAVQLEIIIQKEKYKQAIRDNKQFEEVKGIYLVLKELIKQESELVDRSLQKASEISSQAPVETKA